MKTIYNTYIPVTSQEQADRLKQICLDNALPIWENETAFDLMFDADIFTYLKPSRQFFIVKLEHYYDVCPEDIKTEITEEKFIELLKPLKNENRH